MNGLDESKLKNEEKLKQFEEKQMIIWDNSFKKIFNVDTFNKKQLKFHELSLKNMIYHFNYFYYQSD